MLKSSSNSLHFYSRRINPLNYLLHNSKKERLPFTWTLFVTKKCNSRCGQCFYWKELNQKNDDLTLDEINKISNGMGKFNMLLLSGGEPMLRDDLPEICSIFYKNNSIKRIHLPTNGLLPDKTYNQVKSILEKCKDMEITVGLPLDGLEETNDLLRGVKGTFKKVVKTSEELAGLKEKYPNLTTYIITVVSNKNYEEFIPLAEFVKTLPVDSHGPSPMRGNPKNSDLTAPTSTQWESLIKKLQISDNVVFQKGFGLRAVLQNSRKMSIYKSIAKILDGKFITRCIAGELVGVIEPDGGVRLCELHPVVGNLRENSYDINKVWFSENAEKMRKKLNRCTCTHICYLGPSRDIKPWLFLKSFFGK